MTEDEARRTLILAMCPARVCRVCGEPSRRIREHLGRERFRNPPTPEEFGKLMREAMDAGGLTVDDVAERLRISPMMVGWYRGTPNRTDLPSLERWQQLTEILSFPPALLEAMEIIDREYDTPDRGNRQVKERLSGGALNGDRPKVVATGWSDCGHDDWRPGVVLDPFA